MSKRLKPTSGKQWRKAREDGNVWTLPSGNNVKLRPVALDNLLMSGSLPDILTPIAAKTLWADTSIDDIASASELAHGMAELINIVCKSALMEPVIVDEPTADNEIKLEDIEFTDKYQVFQFATQPTEVLRRFRAEQEANVDAVPNGENLQPAS